ncbi:SPOR domain-containing protein [Streptomyces sp. FH025]|uniref:SPOR domain-containing protein n=1 Tax=Streptomyces sp. FH025 TaxID=2815937 RepID=UPI001A9D7D70|nr:SPOR domain-containing protein [Streptomyces sp. FH025]MBO1420122.1 SPOR domain-containing protein [Streptomyces sp. FH025]
MGTFRVMRQDDNGNRFTVAKGLDEAEARRLAAEFEARGHKQLYWVESEARSEAP